jgi:hypothetical protein
VSGATTHRENAPEFCIIGVPKAGTTFLYNLMIGNGFDGVGKDQYFLNSPTSGLHDFRTFRPTARDYRFPVTRPVDACATYAFQEHALAVLSEMDSVRVVIVLREPAERLVSIVRYFRDNKGILPSGVSDEDLIDALLRGEVAVGDETVDDAVEHGRYEVIVPRWEAAVGTARLTVLEYSGLIKAPAEVFRQLVQLAGDVVISDRLNATIDPRFAKLHGGLRQLRSKGWIPPVPDWARSRYQSLVMAPNSTTASISDTMQERLRAEYGSTYRWLDERGLKV